MSRRHFTYFHCVTSVITRNKHKIIAWSYYPRLSTLFDDVISLCGSFGNIAADGLHIETYSLGQLEGL